MLGELDNLVVHSIFHFIGTRTALTAFLTPKSLVANADGAVGPLTLHLCGAIFGATTTLRWRQQAVMGGHCFGCASLVLLRKCETCSDVAG